MEIVARLDKMVPKGVIVKYKENEIGYVNDCKIKNGIIFVNMTITDEKTKQLLKGNLLKRAEYNLSYLILKEK